MALESKRLKSAKKEDRFSDLPDHLIHHILSFLPSTKQAIRTGILSKRWRKQWTQVPVLIFDSFGMSPRNFNSFVDNALTLHECSKIKTFHLNCHCHSYYKNDPNFDEKIRFATTKQVEDLSLSCKGCRGWCSLPESLLNSISLVKLSTTWFSFNLIRKVNWVRLKALTLSHCRLSDQEIDHVLSGSPSLELLELEDLDWYKRHRLAITTKSLKKLVLSYLCFGILEISCPNLEELSLRRLLTGDATLVGQAIENVLSNSLLLESLTLHSCHRLHLPVIASQSLKRLVMDDIRSSYSFEICCEKLEDIKLWGFENIPNVKFRNMPHSLCANLNLYRPYSPKEAQNSFMVNIMQQLQHIKELRVRKVMVEMLTGFAVGNPPFPLHIKCLILDYPIQHKPLSGIICLLQNLPVLETFVFKLFFTDPCDDMPDFDGFGENYWSSNNCLVSHLKRITIRGVLQGGEKPMRVLKFIQFLLNNARVLEHMAVVLTAPSHEQCRFELSEESLRFIPRSKHATVELISKYS